ncbi:MAG: hypothetical protein NTZ24_16875, partial [Deltaproteobacteria bacterium]|nr:hypothetical protein [Deltaproteobacteria bacterium]
ISLWIKAEATSHIISRPRRHFQKTSRLWQFPGIRENWGQLQMLFFTTIHLVISETLSRKKDSWLEMTVPATVRLWTVAIIERMERKQFYGSSD